MRRRAGRTHPEVSGLEPLTNPDFLATWTREDAPVATDSANRAWLWGPGPFTAELQEPYGNSNRTVQYFDKARMEINDPAGERDRWFVTTGLLATELMTGAMQVSDHAYVQRGPALIPLAGDADDPDAPTYASFDRVRKATPFNTGTTLIRTIDREGRVGIDQRFARHAAIATVHVPETGHTIANVFWNFLRQTGPVVEGGQTVQGRVFEPWYYAVGLPVTEAYWSSVRVGGEPKDVLIQVFERRVLTYTPANEPAWRVEPGNVGLHYYWWRYQRDTSMPQPAGSPVWAPDLDRADEVIELEHAASGGPFSLQARYWHGGPALLQEGYRVSVDLRLTGQGDAGLGVQLAGSGDALTALTLFSVSHDGRRHVTREHFDSGRTDFLLRPAPIADWNATPGAWNTLAVTIHAGHAWLEANTRIIAQLELPTADSFSGIALVTAGGDGALIAGFRNLRMEPVITLG